MRPIILAIAVFATSQFAQARFERVPEEKEAAIVTAAGDAIARMKPRGTSLASNTCIWKNVKSTREQSQILITRSSGKHVP